MRCISVNNENQYETVWKMTLLTIFQGLETILDDGRKIGGPYLGRIMFFLERYKMESTGDFPSTCMLDDYRREFPKFDPQEYIDDPQLELYKTVKKYLKTQDGNVPKKEFEILMNIIKDLMDQYPM